MIFFVFAFLIFSGAMFGAAWYVWQVPQQEAARTVSGRLRELRGGNTRTRSSSSPDLLRKEERGAMAGLGDFFNWMGVLRRLQVRIQQANLKYRAQDVFAFCIGLAIVLFVITSIASLNVFLRLVISLGIAYLPVFYINRTRARRLGKFEENLPDAIDLFTRTMRSGHNIHSGLETISTETSDPIKMEFRKVMEELALGSPIEAALHSLGERIPLIDLKFFITGLILQRQTGANMVGVLENLSMLVRERLNMAAKMKAHTAQQRFSAGLLCAMPIVVALGVWVLKPEYIHILTSDPVGSKFLTYAIISEIVGILVIRKLSNVKV